MEAKLWSVLSARMAMRLKSLILPKKFSMRCRHLYLVDDEELCSARMLGDYNLGVARVEFGNNGGAVERLVGDQRADIRLHPVAEALPRRPGSTGLPRQNDSIVAHWASVKTNRSIRYLNHKQARVRNGSNAAIVCDQT
jgi:hypothetical protein